MMIDEEFVKEYRELVRNPESDIDQLIELLEDTNVFEVKGTSLALGRDALNEAIAQVTHQYSLMMADLMEVEDSPVECATALMKFSLFVDGVKFTGAACG